MAVMDERKVFGASGATTLKELLAEAEAPAAKRQRTASPAANGTHRPGRSASNGNARP